MNLGLYYNTSDQIRGPQKVVSNLLGGLKILGIEPKVNETREYTGCLQGGVPNYYTLPRNTLMGPNLVVTPDNNAALWGLYKNFIVPCQWVKDLYQKYSLTSGTTSDIWSVGIDTDHYVPSSVNPRVDCLLYVKNRQDHEILAVRKMLEKLGLTYTELHYGHYDNSHFLDVIHSCRFCFLLTHTESQGIAYMEILSTNTPCFVWDQNNWNGHPATSTPYFSLKCGRISQDLNEKQFQFFLDNLNSYAPREYILANHTLEISAKNYIDLVRSAAA